MDSRSIRLLLFLLLIGLAPLACKATFDNPEQVGPGDTTTTHTDTNGQDTFTGADGQDAVDGTSSPDVLVDASDIVGDVPSPDADTGEPPAAPRHQWNYRHEGEPPWGLHFELVEVLGASGADDRFHVGDTPTMIFRVFDDNGEPYDPREFGQLDFGLTGPSTHMTQVYPLTSYRVKGPGPPSAQHPERISDYLLPEDAAHATFRDRIAYSYTFPDPIPGKYALAPNDSPAIGADRGDWGGQDLLDGTYQFAVTGYQTITLPTGDIREGESDTHWALIGDTTDYEPRQRVLPENCVACHGPRIIAHGGTRVGDVNLCITCHVQGAEDKKPTSGDDPTPATTIFMPTMVHRIHYGSGLGDPNSAKFAGYPSSPAGEGYALGYNMKDFGGVTFPAWPNGVAQCVMCHGGAAQGDIQSRATRNACGACHDTVIWTTGARHGDPPQQPQLDDTGCSNVGCHPPERIVAVHLDPRLDEVNFFPGLNIEIKSVTGGTGDNGQFMPANASTGFAGDTISVNFTILDTAGEPWMITDPLLSNGVFETDGTGSDRGDISMLNIKFGGPLNHSQRIFDCARGACDVKNPLNTTYNPSDKSFTWTSKNIPEFYPKQPNDTDALGFDEVGDWKGLPIVSGTYRVSVKAAMRIPERDLRRPVTVTTDVLVGTATKYDSRNIVSNETCDSCHRMVWMHGEQRNNIDDCVLCHTQGSEDRYSFPYWKTDPTAKWNDATATPMADPTPGRTVDFREMIHAIHSGSVLDKDLSIMAYPSGPGSEYFCTIAGPPPPGGPATCGARTINFNHIVFPRFDGHTANCKSCHVGDSAEQIPTEHAARVCLSCHDNDNAAAHAALNTDPIWGESCNVCHGLGRSSSVDEVHDNHIHWHLGH